MTLKEKLNSPQRRGGAEKPETVLRPCLTGKTAKPYPTWFSLCASASLRFKWRLVGLKCAALALMLAALPAQAVEYQAVQRDKSSLNFGYRQMGVAMDGRFSRFQAQMAFDPAKPGAARVSLDVDLASIDVGSDEGNGEVAGKPWFHTKAFPVARFVADSVKPLGGNRYQLKGKLTIKGITRELLVPATFTPQAGAAAFDGVFQIRRADFAIGEGVWADFGAVANEISIKFHILAAAGK